MIVQTTTKNSSLIMLFFLHSMLARYVCGEDQFPGEYFSLRTWKATREEWSPKKESGAPSLASTLYTEKEHHMSLLSPFPVFTKIARTTVARAKVSGGICVCGFFRRIQDSNMAVEGGWKWM